MVQGRTPLVLLVASICGQIGRVTAVASFLTLPQGNSFTSLTYTLTVPDATIANNGKVAIQSGFHTSGDKTVQHPTLSPGSPTKPTNDAEKSFKQQWQLAHFYQPETGVNLGNDQKFPTSLWVPSGGQVTCTLSPTNTEFTMSCSLAGEALATAKAAGEAFTATSKVDPKTLGINDQGQAVATIFLIEAELDGTTTPEWNFPIVYSSVTLVAQSTNGLANTCGGLSKDVEQGGDGAGVIAPDGFKIEGTTCFWDTLAIIPESLKGQKADIIAKDQAAFPRGGATTSAAGTPAAATNAALTSTGSTTAAAAATSTPTSISTSNATTESPAAPAAKAATAAKKGSSKKGRKHKHGKSFDTCGEEPKRKASKPNHRRHHKY